MGFNGIYPLVICYIAMENDGPNRNRWFTVLKNGGSFHGELLNNQIVIVKAYQDDWHVTIATSLACCC